MNTMITTEATPNKSETKVVFAILAHFRTFSEKRTSGIPRSIVTPMRVLWVFDRLSGIILALPMMSPAA